MIHIVHYVNCKHIQKKSTKYYIRLIVPVSTAAAGFAVSLRCDSLWHVPKDVLPLSDKGFFYRPDKYASACVKRTRIVQ